MECPEGKYYDHGVDNCEPCDDYCRYTSLPSFVELCQEYCPKVYKQLMDQQKEPETGFLSDSPSPASGGTTFSNVATIALIAVVTLAVISVAVIVGIFIYNKVQQKKSQNQLPRRNGSTTSNSQCRYSGVEEENGEQAESERLSQSQGLLSSMCDPRQLFSGAGMQETGQTGRNEMALLGSSQESGIQESSQLKTFQVQSPIYKPSAALTSQPTSTRV